MMETENEYPATSVFPLTPWTLLFKVRAKDADALESLCKTYWKPVWVYFRSRTESIEDAEDLTQRFFESLIASESLESADRAAGRLRAYLLTMAKRFQISEWRKQGAQKRGGDAQHVPLDSMDGETGLADEALYDRTWAYAVLAAVSENLEARYEGSGKRDLYEAIKGSLEGDGKYQVTAERAAELGLTPAGLRSAVFRLRRQFRELLESEVAKTCESPEEVREEIADLCRILAE